jgi:PPOX class probable F420-dependent enzyme
MKEQRRGARIAMSEDERDEFLRTERTCRVATTGENGRPHVTPLWFVWDGASLWLTSITRSQRWADIERQPQVSIVVDAGETYSELRGVEIQGTAAPIGEVPRTGSPVPELAGPELVYARKYAGGDTMFHDGRHGWLRVRPDKIVSWDFRKMGG